MEEQQEVASVGRNTEGFGEGGSGGGSGGGGISLGQQAPGASGHRRTRSPRTTHAGAGRGPECPVTLETGEAVDFTAPEESNCPGEQAAASA